MTLLILCWLPLGVHADGVTLVADINPGTANGASGHIEGPIRVGNRLFFTANDGTHGTELWVMEDDLSNPRLAIDFYPGIWSSSASYLTELNGWLYLVATTDIAVTGVHTSGLYVVNPNSMTSTLIKSLPERAGDPGSGPGDVHLTRVGNQLYFRTYATGSGSDLWLSDGSVAGTSRLMTFDTSTSSSPRDFTLFDGWVYFVVKPDSVSGQLWRTDNSVAGTTMVYSLPEGADEEAEPSYLTVAGNHLFFTMEHPDYGREMWAVAAGGNTASMVADLMPGTDSSYPQGLVAVGDSLYFVAQDPTYGMEPRFIASGNTLSIGLLGDITPGSLDTYFDEGVAVLGDKAFYGLEESYRDGVYWPGAELYGASLNHGTGLIKDIYPGYESSPYSFTATRNFVYFFADSAGRGYELWQSDGTSGGTTLVADINPGSSSSNGITVKPVGNLVFVWAARNDVGYELWVHRDYNGILTGVAWDDVNGDGIRQTTELPIQYVTVKLLDQSASEIDSTVTDYNGRYTFDNLAPGEYRPVFELPPGFTFSPALQGGDPDVDSNADPSTGTGLIVGIGENEKVDHNDAGLIPGVLYVKQDARGDGTGEDWDNAFPELRDALNVALTGIHVWVAAGFYTPSGTGDQWESFSLRRGVWVLGGFAGTETSDTQARPGTNEVVLSGNIDGEATANPADVSAADYWDNNSYHVVQMYTDSYLYGVTVEGGASSVGYNGSYGGGIYAYGTHIWVDNCFIWYNRANTGGGVYATTGDITLRNCVVYYNTAEWGGGIAGYQANVYLTNCTVTRNSANASYAGGGIDISGKRLSIINTILWYNTQYDYYQRSATMEAYYSNIAGGFAGVGNLNLPPRFVNWYSGNLRLTAFSPCIDSGYSGTDYSVTNYDLIDHPRVDVPSVRNIGAGTPDYADMGAYEYQTSSASPVVIELRPGWNQVALPFTPDVSVPTDLFGEDTYTFRLAKTIPGTDRDRYRHITYEYEEATVLHPYESYWVYLPEEYTETRTIDVTRHDPLSGTAELTIGWNMLGFPYLLSVKEIYHRYPAILKVYEWNAATQEYQALRAEDYVGPGTGYIVFTYKHLQLPFGLPDTGD